MSKHSIYDILFVSLAIFDAMLDRMRDQTFDLTDEPGLLKAIYHITEDKEFFDDASSEDIRLYQIKQQIDKMLILGRQQLQTQRPD